MKLDENKHIPMNRDIATMEMTPYNKIADVCKNTVITKPIGVLQSYGKLGWKDKHVKKKKSGVELERFLEKKNQLFCNLPYWCCQT